MEGKNVKNIRTVTISLKEYRELIEKNVTLKCALDRSNEKRCEYAARIDEHKELIALLKKRIEELEEKKNESV